MTKVMNTIRFFGNSSMAIAIEGKGGKTLFVRPKGDKNSLGENGYMGLVVKNQSVAKALDWFLNGIGQGVGGNWKLWWYYATYNFHPRQIKQNISYWRYLAKI